jgi:hypothetical protein
VKWSLIVIIYFRVWSTTQFLYYSKRFYFPVSTILSILQVWQKCVSVCSTYYYSCISFIKPCHLIYWAPLHIPNSIPSIPQREPTTLESWWWPEILSIHRHQLTQHFALFNAGFVEHCLGFSSLDTPIFCSLFYTNPNLCEHKFQFDKMPVTFHPAKLL